MNTNKCISVTIIPAVFGLLLALAIVPKVDAQSIYEPYAFSTLAGQAGSAGAVDGIGNAARFSNPGGVAVDISGNVYVADTRNNTIRQITPGGVVTTLAGSAGIGGSTDDAGSAARFFFPQGVAVDGSGNIYVADQVNCTIRKVTPSGSVTTVAGSGGPGSADGLGRAAEFWSPMSVAVDASNNIYVADTGNSTIRKITPSGEVTTLAGSAGSPGGTDGNGSDARFDSPQGVAVDASGNVYVADTFNFTIRKITPAGDVTTLAGAAGNQGNNDGTGSAAQFSHPGGVAVDNAGNIYVANSSNTTIRKVTPAGIVTTIGGLVNVTGSDDGVGSAARFFRPQSVAVDANGRVYVADTENQTIRIGMPAPPAQVLNLSTRISVQTGDNALIHEFVIQGSTPKDILFRGIGPSLAAFGIQDALADPLLELRDRSGALLASNDNWMESQPNAIVESGLAPTAPGEAALRTLLPPGMYSVEVRGVNGGTGLGLNEIYDLAPSSSALSAVGSRAFVGSGGNVLIGGFMTGSAAGDVLVLALGPSLGAAVPKALTDPALELRDQNGAVIASNDNWKSDQQQAIQDTGLAPSDDRESGFILQLGRGAFTAIVRGNGFGPDTVGTGWIQVYSLPYTGEKLNPLPIVGTPNPAPTPTPTPPPPLGAPNLAFFSPGWTDKILVSNTTGTQTDAPVLTPTDPLYVDFGMINVGQSSTFAPFFVEVSVDNTPVASLLKPPLGSLLFTANFDVPIGSLPAGNHTIRIRLDSTNAIPESNEGDNQYTKNIVVSGPVPTPTPGTVTPVGNNVPVDLGAVGAAAIQITFPQVNTAGGTTVFPIPGDAAHPIPSDYILNGAGFAFEIATTATYTGPITIAFQVPSVDAAAFPQLKVLHYEANTGWVDVTIPTPVPDPHPGIQTVYAQVSSLSPFVLATSIYRAAVQSPINPDKTSVFTSKRGVVPVKFNLTSRGNATCALPPATISLTRTAGAASGTVNESTYSMSADSGSSFRIDSCQYIYNLNAGALGLGTYRADIKINGSSVGTATFQLK